MTGAVPVPSDVLRQLVAVASHVSLGASAAFAQDRPYPDATARMALGALVDAGVLTVPKPTRTCGHRAENLIGGVNVCIKDTGHDPADPWHQAFDGTRWAPNEQEEQR